MTILLDREVRHVGLTPEHPVTSQTKSKVWAIYQPIEKGKHCLIHINMIIRKQIIILLHKNGRKPSLLCVFSLQLLQQNSSISWASPMPYLVSRDAEFHRLHVYQQIILIIYAVWAIGEFFWGGKQAFSLVNSHHVRIWRHLSMIATRQMVIPLKLFACDICKQRISAAGVAIVHACMQEGGNPLIVIADIKYAIICVECNTYAILRDYTSSCDYMLLELDKRMSDGSSKT